MPLVECASIDELEKFVRKWITSVRNGKYVAFWASSNEELILIPTRSTSPLLYATVRASKANPENEERTEYRLAVEMLERNHVPKPIHCAVWHWDASRIATSTE